jgi:KaiC/GvpD/RAD55 family RecA-like ATPase
MERRLVKSGIAGLDELLGGGFLDGQIITLSGPTGCGKSTMAMQFLYQGIVKYKEPGLYIAIEESKDAMEFHMSGYVWDLNKVEKEKKLIFLDYPIYEIDQFLNQYSAIQEIVQTTGVKRVVIDSIMPVALYFASDEERKKGFLRLIDNIRKWRATTMIVSEDTPATTQDVLPDTKYGIESFTDAWLHIYYLFDTKKRERIRAIEVLKTKGMSHSTRIHPAKVDAQGFTILANK